VENSTNRESATARGRVAKKKARGDLPMSTNGSGPHAPPPPHAYLGRSKAEVDHELAP
jgi:hypothetical protein